MPCSECGTERLHSSANYCPYPKPGDPLRAPNISAAALPNKGGPVMAVDAKEKRWERDLPAYKSLRKDGLQPPAIDGSDRLSAEATHKDQIAMGNTKINPRAFEAFHETFGRSALTPATPE